MKTTIALLVNLFISNSYALDKVFQQNVSGSHNRVFEFINSASLGNPSTSLSQLKVYNDKNLFAGRIKNTNNNYFSLELYKFGTDFKFRKEKLLLDTSSTKVIHNGKFSITTAYDPYVEWHDGQQWIAFECHGPTFNNHPSLGTSVGICLGSLDLNNNINLSSTRVLVSGSGDISNIVYSASVPKLLSHAGKLYIYWTSVKKDTSSTHLDRRVRASIRYRLDKRWCLTGSTAATLGISPQCLFKELMTDNGTRYVYTEQSDFKEDIESEFSGTASEKEASYYNWLAGKLNAADIYTTYSNCNSNGCTKVADATARDVLAFTKLESYGTEVKFNGSSTPYLQEGIGNSTGNATWEGIALAHEFALGGAYENKAVMRTISNNPEYSRVADMFDVRKKGGKFYFIFSLGGHNESYTNFHCTSASVGASEDGKGCYTIGVYDTTTPLPNNLNATNREDLNLTYSGSYSGCDEMDIPAFSYSRYFMNPHNQNQTYISAKVMNDCHTGTLRALKMMDDSRLERSHLKRTTLLSVTANDENILRQGNGIVSANKRYSLIVRNNGLVIYDLQTKSIKQQIASVATHNTEGLSLVMQRDGNLVLTRPSSGAIWSSQTNTGTHASNRKVVIGDDGVLKLYYGNSWKKTF